MKNILILLAVLIPIAIFSGFLYLIWEVWHIFGFWRIFGLSVLLIAIQLIARKSSLKREETASGIIYAPKELPIYLGVLCGFGSIAYLYTHLNSATNLTENEYLFGIAYLILNGIQILRQLVTVFLNRHDKVEVNSDGIFWVDIEKGKDLGQKIAWSDIKKIDSEIGKIIIEMKDSTKHNLVPLQMNMALFQAQLHEDIMSIGKVHGDFSVEEDICAKKEETDTTNEVTLQNDPKNESQEETDTTAKIAAEDEEINNESENIETEK